MSGHPPVQMPRTHEGHNDVDNPTTQLPSRQYSGDPHNESSSAAPTRTFAGFRRGRWSRGPDPWVATLSSALASLSRAPHRDSILVIGVPRVETAEFGGHTDRLVGPEHAWCCPEAVPHTLHPELFTRMLMRLVKPSPSEGLRRVLYMLSDQPINLRKIPGCPLQQRLGGLNKSASTGLLPDCGTVPERWGWQNHNHCDVGFDVCCYPRRSGSGRRCQPRSRYFGPEGFVGNAGYRAPVTARRPSHRTLQRRSPLHFARRERDVKC